VRRLFVLLGLLGACALTAAPAIAKAPSANTQAREVYAPVATFYRSLTKAQRKQIKTAPKLDARRVDACQRPYQNKLFRSRVGTARNKVYTIYEDVGLLQQIESVEAIAVPQFTAAEQKWAGMKLANGKLQGLAHAQAAELAASLDAPQVDACTFLIALAQHKFSLSWAKEQTAATTAVEFLAKVSHQSQASARGSNYIYKQHLLSRTQQIALVNFPGQVS
jgi:hypothetical protein